MHIRYTQFPKEKQGGGQSRILLVSSKFVSAI
ncbi:Uncharacterised protein [Vibrio cholerae]|nr:Uncharacterised protein [Vibrio cholerae]CSC03992.1 Uncharacterised protein [Vibrio cholerae]